MAEYLIQDTTLDAIADAINAKTGGSAAMTPAEMVTAIGSISGGGGLTPVLVTSTGGSLNDVLTQCRAAVGSQQVFVINAKQAAPESNEYFLYYGIYVDITNGGNTRHFNLVYRKNTAGNYATTEFTSTSTSGGATASGTQFYVWALDGVFEP